MPTAKTRSVLSGMRVKEAMRRQIVAVDRTRVARSGIERMIKCKADLLLIAGEKGEPAGIVSKTDLTGAYYAGLPVDIALGDIMMGPLISCFTDDPLEDALETMSRHGVHQLFVKGPDADRYEGLLTYGDILGLVYRYCHRCRKSHARRPSDGADAHFPLAQVKWTEGMRFVGRAGGGHGYPGWRQSHGTRSDGNGRVRRGGGSFHVVSWNHHPVRYFGWQ